MGGLIVRYAIDQVQKNKPGWPPDIIVPSVVTFGTPHGGVDWAGFFCTTNQCDQMDSSSSFIDYLQASARNPQGQYGTWWSLAGSHADNTVDQDSATDMSVQFKIHWASEVGIEHSDYMHEKDHDNFTIGAHCWGTSTGGSMTEGKCYWPLQWSYVVLAYYGY